MGEQAPRRWYPSLLVLMCIRLVLQATISFRAAPKAIHIAFSGFAAISKKRIPSYKTIARWLTQIGLYKLNSSKEQANDWALIVDNSVQIGQHKLLVVLGTRLSKFKRKALAYEDVEVLVMEVHKKSDSERVCKALEKAQYRVGKVVMVCADDGSDLRGGIACFCEKYNVGRVFDIVHKIGTFLKRFLEKDPKWQAFTSMAAIAKKRMQQTEAAHLVPPNQRTKSRFLNIEILVSWGSDIISALANPLHPDKKLLEKYCSWVLQHKELLERLKQIDLISCSVRNYIREQGFCATTGDQIETILEEAIEHSDYNGDACEYAGMLIDFCREQSKLVPLGQVWIGSSEVIESLFGKLKALEQDQSKGGFTTLILGMAACVGKIDITTVQAALKQIKIDDVRAWGKQELGTTLLTKRRKTLGTWKKKRRKKREQNPTGESLGEAMGF